MSLMWLDAKYLSMLSFRLRNFKRKNTNNWNFSCPFCGDSKTDRRKARGYVYPVKGKLRFYCHNCNVPGIDIPKLLKHEDPNLYDEYIREKLVADPERKPERTKSEVQIFAEKMKTPQFVKQSPLKQLKKVSQYKPDSVIKQWVERRKIPSKYHFKLFVCKEFKHWVNSFIPGKFENVDNDEPRLIIPFLDKEGNMFGFQGRSFRKNTPLRYITIMLDESKSKLFGLDTLDERQPIYVVEGPIDSMFLPNCIASAGSDVTSNLDTISTDKSKFIIVYDNEPRNKEIVKKIEKSIEAGYPTCIWPDNIEFKDINDMILGGYKQRKIVEIITDNTLTGLEAKLRFATWKKV